MITLGINAAFHDSAAALVVDGEVVAAAEEERFTRIKHGKRPVPFTAWELPFNAIDYCLGAAGVTLAGIDHVAYSFDPDALDGGAGDADGDGATSIALPIRPSRSLPSAATSSQSPWDPLFLAYLRNAPEQLVDGAPHHLAARFAGIDVRRPPYRWHFVGHHLAHQASAFLAAPFDACAVMTIDGRGERATTSYGVCASRDGTLVYRSLGGVEMPSSLGLLYEKITSHLGFLHSSDEYKVMALAALGTPTLKAALRDHVHVGAGGQYVVDRFDSEALFGAPRRRGAPLEQRHLDLAASLQDVLEETVLAVAAWLREASGERRLAMAGGVALNCVMNSRLRDSGLFDDVWVQPAAGDAGTALGAALWVDSRSRAVSLPASASASASASATASASASASSPSPAPARSPPLSPSPAQSPAATPLAPRRWTMAHAYLGPGFDDDAIERTLAWAKLTYRRCADDAELVDAVAALLAADRIVGWFQGRMEFGPRALGARSILASPIDPAMQVRLNELKDREDFRPVAPAVAQEDMAAWFAPADANGGSSPFMLFVYDVAAEQAARIPSACHTDRSARVQTVDAATNPRFHALLRAFGKRTGVPVLVNTSFNVRGEPIVGTPRAAVEAFFSTPLDALAIGSFIVEKTR
ncbi:MAG TPA: carbamoyltransferase C-terminal domain-containing protein [Caldimonas sp.]|nr:carbamoyltransferase C-terminal domain-containing protein [Caldimonas sp.]